MTIGDRHKPKPLVKPRGGSGTVRHITSGVMIMRDRRRVRIGKGDRIVEGDEIITSDRGTVRIAFDDPSAGPDGNGLLSIAPGSRVEIKVPPYQATRQKPPQINVRQGVVQYHRPHRRNAMPIRIQSTQAIFDVTGTDVIVEGYPDYSALALSTGTAKVSVPSLGTGSFPVPRGHVVLVRPKEVERVRFFLNETVNYFRYAAYIADPVRNEMPRFDLLPGHAFFAAFGPVTWRSVLPASGYRQRPGTTLAPEFVWTPGERHLDLNGVVASKRRGYFEPVPGKTWSQVDPYGVIKNRR